VEISIMPFSAFSLFRTPRARASRTDSRRQENAFRPTFEALENRCLLSAGALDAAFGNGGLVSGGQIAQTHAVAVYPAGSANAGKVVIGGYIPNPTQAFQWALERFNPDGTPDIGFGNNGIVTSTSVNIGHPTYQTIEVNALAIQSDGKIVAVGPIGAWEFGMARYNSDGSLDTTFTGGNRTGTGFVATPVTVGKNTGSNLDFPMAVAIQGGKIVVAGFVSCQPSLGRTADFALIRYNQSDGSLDTTFGSNRSGIVVTSTASVDEARALAIQSDGKIVVAGGTYTNTGGIFDDTPVAMAMARYTTSGSLDPSFGNGGWVILKPSTSSAASASGVAIQADGKIVVGGYSRVGTSYLDPNSLNASDLLTVARLNPNGTPDSSFGASGFAVSNSLVAARDAGFRVQITNPIGLSTNGDILATGSALNTATPDFGVEALLPSGAPDSAFGSAGIATADFAGGTDLPHAVAIQGDGKIVVVGDTTPSGSSTSYLALARFLPPDTKIGSFTASPNPVTAGSFVTLTVSGILNSNPTSTIGSIVFYLDGVGGTPLTVSLISNRNGTWTYSFDTTGLSGPHTIYAEAVDSSNAFSDPVSVTLTVQ
jgi:uncharacterized delta-60 repeat protein